MIEKTRTFSLIPGTPGRRQQTPRTISVICDNALVNGFAGDFRPIGRQVVMEVCRDFQLGAPENRPPAREAVSPSALGSKQATGEPPAAGRPVPAGDAGAAPESRAPMFSRFTRPKRFSFF